jgi:arylsulfatase A-like enzyme
MKGIDRSSDGRPEGLRRLDWTALWLAAALVGLKAWYLVGPGRAAGSGLWDFVQSLAAISYADIVFAAAFWCAGRAALFAAGGRQLATRLVSFTVLWLAAACCLWAVANVILFSVFGGFVTYPLLSLVGDLRMLRSSVTANLSLRIVLGLVCIPLAYVAAVVATVRLAPRRRRWPELLIALALLVVWVPFGHHGFFVKWATHSERRIAENAHWVFISSWWQAATGVAVRMDNRFPPEDLADFEPIGRQPLVKRASLTPAALRRGTMVRGRRAVAARPPNVILIVLESVAARWASLNSGPYDTTPMLKAESAWSRVFDNVYAPIGRSSNSLAAILLSAYPKLDFRDVTEEYPRLPGTSIASAFRDRGYRTAFVTPSDMHWAGWGAFLAGRGFSEVRDYRTLGCPEFISSWGVEDRCMVDAMLPYVDSAAARPFFLMAWTTQTHHPYEPTPGIPLLDLLREPVRDDWDLGRYLNVLHETDHHLGRLFERLRQTDLDQDTIVIVTGDHGQAFGYPHETFLQGRTIYEEDVHVPLMFWFPRMFRTAVRSNAIGSLVDLAPSIADLAGMPPASDWQGRSLFDVRSSRRAYFYVAEDQFTLGVREGKWKYIFCLRDGSEELYDLDRDPSEQHNLAAAERDRAARLRQRLAAWTEANRRQYERLAGM